MLSAAVLKNVDILPKRMQQGRNDWTAKDKLTYVSKVLKHGKDWNLLSEAFPERDPAGVKKFWTNHHKNLKLDELLQQRKAMNLDHLP